MRRRNTHDIYEVGFTYEGNRGPGCWEGNTESKITDEMTFQGGRSRCLSLD